MKLARIEYSKLNAKQKENHNYHKVSALLPEIIESIPALEGFG